MNKPAVRSQQLNRLFTEPSGQIFYLVIPKCGCTFVKNILWRLHHGAPHPDPKRVHDSDAQFLRAAALDVSDDDVRESQRAFVVLRNPVDRFLSLYFDKVIGDGWKNYVPLRQILIDHYGLDAEPGSTEAHRQNCIRLAAFLADNFRDGAHIKKEAHWTPQADRQNIMRRFDLKVLLTEDLTRHMGTLLSGLGPDTSGIVTASEQYSSGRGALGRSVLDKETRKAVNALYSTDRSLYKSARDAWAKLPSDTDVLAQIPRFSDIAAT